MTQFDYSRLQSRADALHANAKDGTLKLDGRTYTFRFDDREGIYVVTDDTGSTINRYNTRKLTVARKWLREYFSN